MSAAWHQTNIHQGLLEAQLHSIFPRSNIVKNVKKGVAVKNPLTGGYLEVDVWLPDVNVCFEFQDDYHFKPAWYSHSPLSFVQQKDNIKRRNLLERNQTLIEVPYWWDGGPASLQGTIHFHRPDLLCSSAEIAVNPPMQAIAGNKQLMLASFPASDIEGVLKHSAWWVGEKWDGIRCSWNAPENQIYSRRNIIIELHPGVTRGFGALFLDGELWCGRGFFNETQNFMVDSFESLSSSFLRMVCFDEASRYAQHSPFEMRYSLVLSDVPTYHPVATIAPRFLCSSEVQLLSALQNIIQGGGEGLIMRKLQSRYVPGRSEDLLKIKASHSDHEALVVQVYASGSLLLQLPSGATFTVAKRECVIAQQAVRGDIVTFSFDFERRFQAPAQLSAKEYLSSAPSNPVVHRIRSDVSWEEILQNSSLPNRWFGNEAHQFFSESRKDLQAKLLAQENRITKGQSWLMPKERREYFDQFAASKGMDPLNPVFWHSITPRDLLSFHMGYATIKNYYGASLSKTLMTLYPDIGLRKISFKVQSWKKEEDRRAYFDHFAASKESDPLDPNFWYTITPQDLIRYHCGWHTIFKYYGGKLPATVMALYPNIGLKKSRFKVQSWRLKSERKEYFDSYAESKGMDPLNPDFWYGVTTEELRRYHWGGTTIVKYYGGKLSTTLINLYPDIGLQKYRFKAKDLWKNISELKSHFDTYAALQGMDPLNPEFWYRVSRKQLSIFNYTCEAVINHYGGKLSKALIHLYPNIGLKSSGFRAKGLRINAREVAMHFDSFAATKRMDPLNPEFWYHVTRRQLSNYNKACEALINHYGKLSTTLLQIYPKIGLKLSGFSVGNITQTRRVP